MYAPIRFQAYALIGSSSPVGRFEGGGLMGIFEVQRRRLMLGSGVVRILLTLLDMFRISTGYPIRQAIASVQ
jgi:hypothetical protein